MLLGNQVGVGHVPWDGCVCEVKLLHGINLASAFVSFWGGLPFGTRWELVMWAVAVRLIEGAVGKTGWGGLCCLMGALERGGGGRDEIMGYCYRVWCDSICCV